MHPSLCFLLFVAGSLELTPIDPRWVGAWWMGLLVSAGGMFLTSIPYFFFPRAMHVDNVSHAITNIANTVLLYRETLYCFNLNSCNMAFIFKATAGIK